MEFLFIGGTSRSGQSEHLGTWQLGHWVLQKVHPLEPSKRIQWERFPGRGATRGALRPRLGLAWPGWPSCPSLALRRHYLMLICTYKCISLLEGSGWARKRGASLVTAGAAIRRIRRRRSRSCSCTVKQWGLREKRQKADDGGRWTRKKKRRSDLDDDDDIDDDDEFN